MNSALISIIDAFRVLIAHANLWQGHVAIDKLAHKPSSTLLLRVRRRTDRDGRCHRLLCHPNKIRGNSFDACSIAQLNAVIGQGNINEKINLINNRQLTNVRTLI